MQTLRAACRAAEQATLRGDLASGDGVIADLAVHDAPWARSELAGLSGMRWLAAPLRGRVFAPETIEQVGAVDSESRRARTIAAGCGARAAVLAMDAALLSRWVGVLERSIEPASEAEELAHLALARAWSAWLTGHPAYSLELLTPIAAVPPWMSAEATALAALASAESGDVGAGLALARSASRGVREVPLLYARVLAQIALARLRRLSGRHVLGAHILTSTRPHTPDPWTGWLDWELFLASGDVPPSRTTSPFPSSAFAVVDVARAGDRETLSRARSTAERVMTLAPFAREQAQVFDAIDPNRTPGDEATLAWARGGVASPPAAVRALASRATGEIKASLVFAGPAVAARRFCEAGQALAGEVTALRTSSRAVRSLTLLSALTLAGRDGVEPAAAFRAVYGFSYDPPVHAGLFRVLIHRTRKLIEHLGAIGSDGGVLRVEWHRSVVFVDPRGEVSLEDAVLQFLANRSASRARDVAEILNVPLRTAQQALHQLSEEGVVDARRVGNGHAYSLEDTCFSRTDLFGP